jgi:hypothetical protein
MTYDEMKEFLESIGGLENGFFTDQPPITDPHFFGVKEGWFQLIKDLIVDLNKMGWDKQVTQVKEKFGGLRFYINSGESEIHQRILQAETESYNICEICGEQGKPRTNGWYQTLCDSHKREGDK